MANTPNTINIVKWYTRLFDSSRDTLIIASRRKIGTGAAEGKGEAQSLPETKPQTMRQRRENFRQIQRGTAKNLSTEEQQYNEPRTGKGNS